MTHQTIKSSHLPKHCIRAPKGFVPHRIKLQRERKAIEAQEKSVMDDCAAWQEHIEEMETFFTD